jgi:hypothetical protein
MKMFKLFVLLCIGILISCSSVKVISDYDTKVDFSSYKTFAFYKKGIDKASVSDLDKKRIMRAIENELIEKGISKSENPDMLISIFTKSREQVNVTDNNIGYGFGWGYNPWFMRGSTNLNINQYTEGTLFIDFIDKNNNELIWQGIGSGAMKMTNIDKKEKRINEFVNKIILAYPPNLKR